MDILDFSVKRWILFFILLGSIHIVWAVIQVVDLTGHEVKLNQPAHRIISLAPNLTEILFDIGAGENIVGVSTSSDYPLKAKKIAKVAEVSQINIEQILKLKPDLVVAWQGGNPPSELAEIQQLKIPVYFFKATHIKDIATAMEDLGKLTGTTKKAFLRAQQFDSFIRDLKKEYSTPKHPKLTFFIIWQKPLFTIGKESLINQAIKLCGGLNVFSNTFGLAPQISLEAVLQANPKVIIGGFYSDSWKKYWQQWSQLQAVKNHQLFNINPDLLERPGPRFVLGIKELCKILHG